MNDISDNTFTIGLTAEEGKLVLEALAECPFKHVYELIGRLNRQANEGYADDRTTHEFSFTAQELALTVKALGEQPFNRVRALVENIDRQMRHQPDNPARASLHG